MRRKLFEIIADLRWAASPSERSTFPEDEMLRRLVIWAALLLFSVRAFRRSLPVSRSISCLSATAGNSTRASLFNIGSDSIMNRLQRQAQLLRTEVDSLAASHERTEVQRKGNWEGIVRDDVKINRTTVLNITTAMNTSMEHASEQPVSLLTPRSIVEDPVSKLVNAIWSSEDYYDLMDKWLEKDEELGKDGQLRNVYNDTALPDLEEIIKDLPFLIKLTARAVDRFSTPGQTAAEELNRKLYVTAVALEFRDFWFRDDDDAPFRRSENVTRAVARRMEELRKMIFIGSPPIEAALNSTKALSPEYLLMNDARFLQWLNESTDVLYILKDYDTEDAVTQILLGFAKSLYDKGIDFSTLDNDQAALYLLRFVQGLEEGEITLGTETAIHTASDAFPKTSAGQFVDTMENSSDAGDLEEVVEMEDFTSLLNSMVEDVKGSAEGVVVSYFDEASRYTGDVFTKESAGRLQDSLLRDIFNVNAVSNKSGAVIFFGSPVGSTTELASKLSEKYAASPYKDSFRYILLRNEYFPELKSVEEMAIDAMFKSSPAVIVYPATWNSTVTEAIRDPIRRAWRSFLISCAILTTTVFATGSLNNIPAVQADASFIPLTFSALTLQTLGALSEVTVASLKGFNTSVLLVPSLRIGSWGPRTLYTSMPQNRNDLFDAAFAGFLITFLASFAALVTGLDVTAHATTSDIANFPSISASILKSNTLIAELFQWKFPGIFDAPIEGNLVHMHWSAFAGLVGLISSVFQLIPLDNSSGSKMCYSILGVETSIVVNGLASFFRLAFLLPFVFNFGAEDYELGVKTLLVDFFFASQFAGNNMVILIDSK